MDAYSTAGRPSVERTPLGSPAISVRGLTKRFGSVRAVDDLSLEVHPGVVTGFLGPNGAGKSTTLRIVLGLVSPTEGSATVLGMPYRSLPEPTRTVGAVLETQSFNPLRSGRNHLRVLASASGIPERRVDEVLELVGLEAAARRNAGTYSLGMRQRLGLGAALLGEPRILILDEPANGLDPQGIRWLRDFLRGFATEGNAVLVSSHVLTEMAQLADEAIVINQGRLVRQASLSELTSDSRELVVVTPEAGRLAAALQGRGLGVVTRDGGELHVSGADAARVGMIAFETRVPVLGLAEKESSLEDAFLELTEEDAR
ncbi:MAG TPA: ATP-binding cassette domain-containing protein [Actinomycetota bacterium]|nr:ATP-binding cassette domain-containing protein [Actinomycetota bacterium]